MTDPMDAFMLFSPAFSRGVIPVQLGCHDRALLVAVDHPGGKTRFSYMRAEGRTLTALVMFVQEGCEDGIPIFSVGYAVGETWRGRGIAKPTLKAAVRELVQGLGGARIPAIEIEAVIGTDNVVSQRVAAAIFEAPPKTIIDSVSGQPALHYVQVVDCPA